MSLQDDHFDLEAHFKRAVRAANTAAKKRQAEAAMQAYYRIWEAFIEVENENEKLRPVSNAATALVQYVVETHYKQNSEE